MNAWLTVFKWGLIIFGIPAVIIGTIWFFKKYGKSDSAIPTNEVNNKDAP